MSSARERFAAIKLVETSLAEAIAGNLRIDTIIWDTHDSRHDIQGRDDISNLERMYFHLLRSIMKYRWPDGTKWSLLPDENSAIDWNSMHEYLEYSGSAYGPQRTLPDDSIQSMISSRDFNVINISEVASSRYPEVQVCDLFAGLGVFSSSEFNVYMDWCTSHSNQMRLPFDGIFNEQVEFSRSQDERCKVVEHLDKLCKESKLQIGLRSTAGLISHNANMPINFWLYTPQHNEDKAPTRKS